MRSNELARRPPTVLASLNQALHAMMEFDRRVVVIGEDILDPYGGAFKVTNGLSTRFPDRVLTTPISEAALVGVATGMAMRGFRPVAELMFGDFLTLAADQLINHAAKFRWMYGDNFPVPLVVRTPMGGRRGYGPTHSQSLEKHFLGVPGLWVVAPHLLGDPGALLQQATLQSEDPVLFIENKTSYQTELVNHVPGMAAESYSDKRDSFPTIYLSHHAAGEVPDGLLYCYGGMTSLCLEAVQQLRDQEGLYINLVVFTQLSPVPVSHIRWVLDKCRPRVCFYAEESSVMNGWSAEMVVQVEELRAEIGETFSIRHERLGGEHLPIASSKELELQTLPQVIDLVGRVVSCF